MKRLFSPLFFLSIILIIGCSEKNSKDPIKCYELWLDQKPTQDVRPLHAQYWQSPHWSKEYILYIELQASVTWKDQFIKQNGLVMSSKDIELPADAPVWFKLGKNYKLWKKPGDD